jgi:hypothetical protein
LPSVFPLSQVIRAPSCCSTPFRFKSLALRCAMTTRSQVEANSLRWSRYHSRTSRFVRFRLGAQPIFLLETVSPIRPTSSSPGAHATRKDLVRKIRERRRCSRYSPVRLMRTARGKLLGRGRATSSR